MTQMTQNLCNNVTGHYFTGNLIPNSWYHTITTKTGRPDSAAISILSEIVYWHRPNRAGAQKFQGDAWQTSYEHFEKKFSYNRETIRRIFVKLEQLGLAHRELRTVGKFGQRYNNVLFIHLNSQKLDLLTGSNSKKICREDHKSDTPYPQIIGDYIEDEIKNKNKTRSDKSNFVEECLSDHRSKHPVALESFEAKIKDTPNMPKNLELIGLECSKKQDLTTSNIAIMTQKSSSSLPRRSLYDFYPLKEEDAVILRKASSREFNLGYINKLLLKLAANYPNNGYYTKALFLSYMSQVLACEKRQAPLVNNIDFTFKAMPGSEAYTLKAQADFLDKIESSTEVNIINLIKRKIVGSFNSDEAYKIITSCQLAPDVIEGEYIIKAPPSITQPQKSTLWQIVRSLTPQTTEVIFKEKGGANELGQGASCNKGYKRTMEDAKTITCSPLWQKIRESLIKRYGESIDKSWFSKCDIEQSPEHKQIVIKTPSIFARDWIKNNYSHAIEGAISEIWHSAKDPLYGTDPKDKGYGWLEWGV